MSTSTAMTEVEILSDVITPSLGDLEPGVAHCILRWKFTAKANTRMATLARRNRAGVLTDAEQTELDRFLRVGSVINLAQAKARLSLQRQRNGRK